VYCDYLFPELKPPNLATEPKFCFYSSSRKAAPKIHG